MPNNLTIEDPKPLNEVALDPKPLNLSEANLLGEEQKYSVTLAAGQLIPVGISRVTYAASQTIQTSYNPS